MWNHPRRWDNKRCERYSSSPPKPSPPPTRHVPRSTMNTSPTNVFPPPSRRPSPAFIPPVLDVNLQLESSFVSFSPFNRHSHFIERALPPHPMKVTWKEAAELCTVKISYGSLRGQPPVWSYGLSWSSARTLMFILCRWNQMNIFAFDSIKMSKNMLFTED